MLSALSFMLSALTEIDLNHESGAGGTDILNRD
jgi:hypothetical protein